MYVDEERFKELGEQLAEKVAESVDPASVIYIREGGRGAGVFLQEYLSEDEPLPLGSVNASHYTGQTREQYLDVGPAQIEEAIGAAQDVERPVLLVDDCVDTGETMQAVVDLLATQNVEIHTAVLHYKEGSRFEPDSYGKIIPEDVWIEYFWERERG